MNKLCSAKTAKNLVGKCLDESKLDHCKTGRYHNGTGKGPSQVRCCVIHASDKKDIFFLEEGEKRTEQEQRWAESTRW